MNQREAKREVCRQIARDLLAHVAAGYIPASSAATSGLDTGRLERATFELIDELLRRAGEEPGGEIAGQLRIEDVHTDLL